MEDDGFFYYKPKRWRARGHRRLGKSSEPKEFIPFRQKVMSFFSRNALILTLIIIVLTMGFSGRDLWMSTIKADASHTVSADESLYESSLYRDVFLPMSEMVIKGDDIETFLIANNKLKRADWYISFYNSSDRTTINIAPRKDLALGNPSVSIRIPIKATPYAFHEISLNGGSEKNISIERYASGNIYYFAGDREKPLSGIQALDDIVKSWH